MITAKTVNKKKRTVFFKRPIILFGVDAISILELVS